MTEVAVAVMDAAEKRMRVGGLNGFSFRDLARDVGVKSSTVHYHFPTKEKLAAAVIRRYTARVLEDSEQNFSIEKDPVRLWTKSYRKTLTSENRLCTCTVVGATALNLPDEVAVEVRNFFQSVRAKMVEQGLSNENAAELLSRLTGASVVANALGDVGIFDSAVHKAFPKKSKSKR